MTNAFTTRTKKPRRSGGPRRAEWNGVTLAETPTTQRVDGREYFPPDAVNWDLLEKSEHTSVCPWKGVATYYDAVVDGQRLPGAAWTYESPTPAAGHISGHVGFWRGVEVVG